MCKNCYLAEAIGRITRSRRPGSASHAFDFNQIDRRAFLAGSIAGATLAGLPLPAIAADSADHAAHEAANKADGVPSIIFRNGKVYTQIPDKPWDEAVAIAGKTILAVGTNDVVTKLAGSTTRVIDLQGKLMLPGFVEAHIHPFLGGFATTGVDLQVPTKEDALAAIAEYAKTHPVKPVRGFGWRVDQFPPEGPSKQALDAIIPDRPAFFFGIDAHSLWVNSKALEIAGVNRDTPDPIPGFSYYARDPDGNPTGFVLEAAAVLAVVDAVEPISLTSMAELLEGWLPKASAAGITTVFDAGVPPIGGDQSQMIQLYTDIEKQGRLPFRVRASYLVKGLPVDTAAQEALTLKQLIKSELVGVNVLKIIGDGTQENFTAWLLEPYADREGDIGASPFTVAQWKSMVAAADQAGLDVHIHACGERTTRVALDAIEAAMLANPKRDRRHTIAHLVYVNDADIPRFKQLGVTAQFSANWMSADPDSNGVMLQRYGPQRHSQLYRPRTTLDTGANISFGTDWPAAGYLSTYKPLDAIQIAMTRQLIGKPNGPVLQPAAERLNLAQAIHANTLGGAYQLRLEDRIGSIEPGKLADLIVLEKNIFDLDPHDIAATKITLTMMNGQVTHGDLA